jgi:hypothetical protein
VDVTVRLAGPDDEEALADLTSRTSDVGAAQFTHDLLVTAQEAGPTPSPEATPPSSGEVGGRAVGREAECRP